MPEPVVSALAASSDPTQVAFPLIIAFVLCLAGFWLWSLIDVLSWPASTWEAAGLSKGHWVTRVLFYGVIGSVLYLRTSRRALRTAYATIRWGD